MKELFKQSEQIEMDRYNDILSQRDAALKQRDIVTQIEYMWKNSPASEFYNRGKLYETDYIQKLQKVY